MNHSSLHFAAASGNQMILIYLLEKRPKILTSTSGNTPLHVVRWNFQQWTNSRSVREMLISSEKCRPGQK